MLLLAFDKDELALLLDPLLAIALVAALLLKWFGVLDRVVDACACATDAVADVAAGVLDDDEEPAENDDGDEAKVDEAILIILWTAIKSDWI